MAVSSGRTDTAPSRREAVEADLLRAIEGLLAEGHSYTELSVEQIASRAGISRTAFYFYFNDKRQVLMRVVEDVAELFYAEADRWWSGSDPDGRAGLRETLTSHLALYRQHAPLLEAIVEAAAYDDHIAAFWRGVMGRFIDATREYVEAEQLAGRGGPLTPEAVSFVVVWMGERVWHQHMTCPAVSDGELIDALSTAIWCTVHGPAGGA